MAERTFNGPVVKSGVHNSVLRDVLLHSPVGRTTSSTNYVIISIGVREGAYTSWIGTWDQSKQKLDAATPVSILDSGRLGMRLKSEQALVVKIESTGSPDTLSGARVNFRMALVGGHDGQAQPLVAPGVQIADPGSRAALATLQRQINIGGLSEWEEPVQLQDVVPQVQSGAFQGRLQADSTTQISLQRFDGNWIEVNGEAVSIGSTGILCTTSDGLLASTGAVTSTAPSSSTLYYVYVSASGLRLSATAPTMYGGSYYLGTDPGEIDWRFCGWVYLNGSTQFTDSDTAREVVNYYNRRRKRLYTSPGYSSNNLATTYTQASATWAKLNAGTGSDVSFIANGEDAIPLKANMHAYLTVVGGIFGVAIGIDGVTTVETAQQAIQTSGSQSQLTAPMVYAPASAGRHVASLLGHQTSGTAVIYADWVRYGATADPAETYLVGTVMV